MSQPALILFAHGARDPAWAGPLQRLREEVLQQAPQRSVSLAFLEFMTPSLPEAIDAAAAAGATAVVVVPVFLAQGGHVRREVPELIAAAQARHPALDIRLGQALGESASVLAAMAQAALQT